MVARTRTGKRLQYLFIHDQTASMGGLRQQVKRDNCRVVNELFDANGDADLEVGVISVLDRHDQGGRDILQLPFTSNRAEIIKYFNSVPDALGNSSWEECYERALHCARSFKWKPDAVKVVPFTGDSEPHPVRHFKNPEGFDWREELGALLKEQRDLKVYPIYALTFGGQSKTFWEEFTKRCDSVLLRLDQFEHISTYLMGIAARARGTFDAWEAAYTDRVKSAKSSIPYAVQRSMDALAGRKPRNFVSRNAGKALAAEGRFQVYQMEETTPADEFFRQLGIIEEKSEYNRHAGELFYAHEIRPSEYIRPNHEVIVEDDTTGEKLFGNDARAMIGIPYGTKEEKDATIPRNFLKPQGYTIWVQSKSKGNARHLDRGIRVMVDLDPKAGFGR